MNAFITKMTVKMNKDEIIEKYINELKLHEDTRIEIKKTWYNNTNIIDVKITLLKEFIDDLKLLS